VAVAVLEPQVAIQTVKQELLGKEIQEHLEDFRQAAAVAVALEPQEILELHMGGWRCRCLFNYIWF
jgi:2,4-dienoyl-CoA reductase-like NADH-dependent reductase (Old Yellow Enzyme family)